MIRVDLPQCLLYAERSFSPAQRTEESDQWGKIKTIGRNISGKRQMRRTIDFPFPLMENDQTVHIGDNLMKPMLDNDESDVFRSNQSKDVRVAQHPRGQGG